MTPRALPAQPVAGCRWSVPAYRPVLMDGDTAFENYWVCERVAMPRPVTQSECSECAYWTPETVFVRARN